MRIIVINPILFTPEKGVIPRVKTIKDTMIYDLCLAYYRAGHTVTLVAARDYAPKQREKYEFEVVFLETRWSRLFKPSLIPFMPGLWHFLKSRRQCVDMVLTSETFSVSSLMAARIFPGKTAIWQELGSHNRKMKKIPSRVWYNVVARLFMRKVWVIPRSYVSQRFIKQYMPRVGEPIGHGVKLVPASADNGVKKPQFLTVGQLIPRKNIGSIMAKFDAFLSNYPQYGNYVLYIAGDGVLRDDYTRQIAEMGRQQQIILLGKLSHEELFRYYRESKASLFDSFRENNMLSLMESISLSTPVITNKVPFNSNEVEENQLGIARDGWNEVDMARVIEQNDFYVENCKHYASLITVDAVAGRIIESFEEASRKK
ncbi:glycosyltransferase family 1 [Barnesiella viscericola DSM 18177]|uniref:Glycosyltransferase family 1 n=1 Tax=Barnesiella viscericola DSM 18177 TaxID=880074 RepID=W0ER55_9BACT|nr:glycosyltransferase [Barnesiella viscericola]AHF12043.1 glycosyltransferase family 1 [Barnesiella viscericola DSM 18177]